MTPAERERIRKNYEMLRPYQPPEGLAILDSLVAELDEQKSPGRAPKVTPERKAEMADKAIAWYARNGGKRQCIADACGVANDADERNALRRILANDPDCRRRLDDIDDAR